MKALIAKKPKNGKTRSKSRMIAIDGNHDKFTHTVKSNNKKKINYDDSSNEEDHDNLGKIFKR